MSDLTAEMVRKIAVKACEETLAKYANIGTNDTPIGKPNGSTSVVELRKERGHDYSATSSVSDIVQETLREYRAMRRDHAGTFIAMARKFARIPGFSNVRAMELAQETFPGSYQDYVLRQESGERLPLIFPKEGREQRLQAAIARGGRLL